MRLIRIACDIADLCCFPHPNLSGSHARSVLPSSRFPSRNIGSQSRTHTTGMQLQVCVRRSPTNFIPTGASGASTTTFLGPDTAEASRTRYFRDRILPGSIADFWPAANNGRSRYSCRLVSTFHFPVAQSRATAAKPETCVNLALHSY